MVGYVFKAIGITGLIIIISGIHAQKQSKQDILFALGGTFLLLYSIYLRDLIFIILQGSFIASSLYQHHKKSTIKN
jgi:lipid-A-disaccharide synthase-like uncharacterized protein